MALTDRDVERLNLISPAAHDVGLGDIIKELQAGESEAPSVSWADITGKPTTFPPSTHTHTASQISDASTVGRSVLTAADAAAVRTAIGAGTSSLALGTTGTTAAAGNHTHVAATGSAAGFMAAADKTKLDGISANAVDASGAVAAIKAKSQIAALTKIADPSTASASDVATLLNSVIDALKA